MSNESAIAIREVFDLRPTNLNEAMEYAKLIAASDLVPKDYKGQPGNVLVAVQMGAEVGLSPMQAIQSIAVINGRPSIWGDGALGLVEASGLLDDFEEMDLAEIGKLGYATCRAVRKGRPTPIVHTFSRKDAERAGLLGKQGPWTQYEPRMLQMRARGFVLRDGFADVLKGLHIREETEDIQPDEQGSVIEMPRRLSEAQRLTDGTLPTLEKQKPSDQPNDAPAQAPETEPISPESLASAIVSTSPACPKCGGPTSYKQDGKWGPWWSCKAYPNCRGSVKDEIWRKAQSDSLFGSRQPGQDG